MKNENFNVNLKTLDDQAMYKEVCKKISEIDKVRFKLLWIVPLISAVGILVLWLEILQVPPIITMVTGLFGALITYFIYRWEKQNIQTSYAFRKYAALLESRKNEQENLKSSESEGGPYSLINNLTSPGLFDKPELILKKRDENNGGGPNGKAKLNGKKEGWGKPEAETAVYFTTIVLWLMVAVLAITKIFTLSLWGYFNNN